VSAHQIDVRLTSLVILANVDRFGYLTFGFRWDLGHPFVANEVRLFLRMGRLNVGVEG
jgi:hypothetical protein